MTIEDVEKVKKAVIRRYPITASLALDKVEIKLDTKIPTACVVGERNDEGILEVKELRINPEFFDLLTFSERVFVLAHECCHIALKHFRRSKDKPDKDAEKEYEEYCRTETNEKKRELKKNLLMKKYHQIWNIATDACINAFLKRDGLAFPSHVVDPKTGQEMQFVDMEDGNFKSAEKIYDYLVEREKEKKKEKEKEKEKQGQQQGDEQPQNSNQSNSSTTSLDDVDIDDYQGIDSHEEWSDDEDDNQIEQNQNDNEQEDDDEELFKKELEEREKKNKDKKSDLKDALSKIREGIGVSKPMDVKPVISWKRLLVGTVEKTEEVWGTRRASRFNPNARIEERTYEALPPIVEVIMDSSGSISSELLKGFLFQLFPLFESMMGEEVRFRVGCFGTSFSGFTEIRSIEDIKRYKPMGGGGTDFEVAATSFTPDPGRQNIKIVFTDGCLGNPQTTKVDNIIWIFFGKFHDFQPVSGRVIQISDKEYDDMISSGFSLDDGYSLRR